jgi:hypothetical protein
MWCKYCVYFYENRKIDLLKLFQEWGQEGIKEKMEGVNSSVIYCKNFCKCHNVPPTITIEKRYELGGGYSVNHISIPLCISIQCLDFLVPSLSI